MMKKLIAVLLVAVLMVACGDQGPPGIQGEKGDQGPPGIQGVQGVQGEIGLNGSQGEVGFIGPQGKQGIQGEKGEKGDKGSPGSGGGSSFNYNIEDYGAIGNGNPSYATGNVKAMQDAVDDAALAGGGVVFVPDGEFDINGKVVISNDNTVFKGNGQSSIVHILNINGNNKGFVFTAKPGVKFLYGVEFRDMQVKWSQDTLTALTMKRTLRATIDNVRWKNVGGHTETDTAIALIGTGHWSGGNLVNDNFISVCHVGILMDDVCNNNMVTSSWIWGRGSQNVGSTGILIKEGSGTQAIIGVDIEGFEKGVESSSSHNRVTSCRFEYLDIGVDILRGNTFPDVKGNSYASVRIPVNCVGSDAVFHGIQMDAGHPIKFGKRVEEINLYSSGENGARFYFWNSDVSAKPVFSIETFGGDNPRTVITSDKKLIIDADVTITGTLTGSSGDSR